MKHYFFVRTKTSSISPRMDGNVEPQSVTQEEYPLSNDTQVVLQDLFEIDDAHEQL